LTELHCSTCHGDDHWACASCGKCLPRRSRLDRLYCSSTCRGRGLKQRERDALERAAREATNPVAADEWTAEEDALIAKIRESEIAIAGGPERYEAKKAAARRRRELKATADRCAECDQLFSAGDVIYRRRRGGGVVSELGLPVSRICAAVLPYCAEHRCGQPDGHHNRDAGEGYHYRGCRCEDHHWMAPTPCLGCERLISDPRGATWRYSRDWQHHYEDGPPAAPRVFCGSECKRRVLAVEAKSRRLAAAAERELIRCTVCTAEFRPRRPDARYCSNACRQVAYRQRKAGRL
jgi:predicted nucleic acid-binding Zn ribbon protein